MDRARFATLLAAGAAGVYAFGGQFKSLLALSLPRAREMTRNRQYGQLPIGIGSDGS